MDHAEFMVRRSGTGGSGGRDRQPGVIPAGAALAAVLHRNEIPVADPDAVPVLAH